MNEWTIVAMVGATLAGALIPIQTGFNTQLARALGSPVLSSIAIFAVGLVALLLLALVSRTPVPSWTAAAAAPGLSWVAGGLLAMLYLLALIVFAPKLGAATVVAFVVLGQILCSTVIDHFGLLGFPVHPVSGLRIAGLVLLAGGVALVKAS